MNFDKSALTFSPNTPQVLAEEIAGDLSVSVVDGHGIHLGLPTITMRNKRCQFGFLRDKVIQKINGWSAKMFSQGGREVLIKSVLQAIPSYSMSCFRLPYSLCHDLEQLCAKFWWQGKEGKRGLHWLNWDSMCLPKCRGGLGFRRFSAFNKSMLAKQVWRIIQMPNSLVARILKSRYFKNVDIMDAGLGSNPSYIWRSLLWGRDLIQKGLCWRVGNELHIKACLIHGSLEYLLSKPASLLLPLLTLQ